jgi:hypothetical protein
MSHVEDSDSRPIFRVSFTGPVLESSVLTAALDGADQRWEGSEHGNEPIGRHRALVGATTEDEAIRVLSAVLAPLGSFAAFRAEPVRDGRGEVIHAPIRKRWDEIDWAKVENKAKLSDLQRTLVGKFLDAGEPTWMILKDPDVPDDRDHVEAALGDLERRGLAYRTWEPAGGPDDFGVLQTRRGHPERMCDWWALTDEGWDLLGLIKSPRYQ